MAARRSPPRSLPRGRHALDAQATAAAHRERLQAAVVALLCEEGYGAMTVDAIATRANVSTGSLYSLYRGKEDLTLATWEAIIAQACTELRASGSAEAPTQLRAALGQTLDALVRAVGAHPELARVAIVEVLSVGAQGPALRRRLVEGLHRRLREAATRDGVVQLPEVALAVLAGGTLQVVDQHLRAGKVRRLRAAAQDLAAWGASYETTAPFPLPAPAAQPYGGGSRPRLPRTLSLPHGRHGLPAGFVRRHQRGRITEAIVGLATEAGCESMTVRQISTRAQISNETFYSHFSSRDEALRGAYDDTVVELFARTWYAAAERPDWPTEIAALVTEWTQFVAAEPELAFFGFSQALSGGRAAAEQADDAYAAFGRLLVRGHPTDPDPTTEPPALVPYALASGIASLAAGWLASGRAADVVGLKPQLVYVVLAPYLGEAAARHAAGLDAAPADTESATDADVRQQLMLAFAESVQEHGYAATRLSDVAQRTGVELDVASRVFVDEEDCAAQAADAWARPLILSAAAAYLSAPNDPAVGAHRALGTALRRVASQPLLTSLALSEAKPLLATQAAQRERHMDLFFGLVARNAPGLDNTQPPQRLMLHMVVDGIVAVVRRFMQEDRIDELPAELPALSRQVLTPFFGPEEAARVAALPLAAEPAIPPV